MHIRYNIYIFRPDETLNINLGREVEKGLEDLQI